MSIHRPQTGGGRERRARPTGGLKPRPTPHGWVVSKSDAGTSGAAPRRAPKSRNPNCLESQPWVAIMLQWEREVLEGTLSIDVVRTTRDDKSADVMHRCAANNLLKRYNK